MVKSPSGVKPMIGTRQRCLVFTCCVVDQKALVPTSPRAGWRKSCSLLLLCLRRFFIYLQARCSLIFFFFFKRFAYFPCLFTADLASRSTHFRSACVLADPCIIHISWSVLAKSVLAGAEDIFSVCLLCPDSFFFFFLLFFCASAWLNPRTLPGVRIRKLRPGDCLTVNAISSWRRLLRCVRVWMSVACVSYLFQWLFIRSFKWSCWE